jgi:hypothetical protein
VKTLVDSKPYVIGQNKAPDGALNLLAIILGYGGHSSMISCGGHHAHPHVRQILYKEECK